MRISDALENASKFLAESGIAEPRREAKSLLSFAIEKDLTFLTAHSEYEPTDEERKRFDEFLARRARHEPLQYIKGKTEFYGLEFRVTPEVLIPRPETELIVEQAIEILGTKSPTRFCEVGIGSGCISIAILHHCPKAVATGLDVAESALVIAKKNAQKNSVAERLELKISDVFSAFMPKENQKTKIGERIPPDFDLIVSNPPYVPLSEFENLQAEVRDFEPRIALTDEGDGLAVIKRIVMDAPDFLVSEGFLLMEFGFNQATEVRSFFSEAFWSSIELFPDLQGIPRMLKAKTKSRSTP
jgi:release factor glutamine methyltransferase